MSNHNRNTDGIKAFAAAKSENVAKRIDLAIRTLMSEKSAINFNSVAIKANVSKTTLYNSADFRLRIEYLRNNQSSILNPKHKKHSMTEKSKDALLVAKNNRITELETEVKRLTAILKKKYADEYDNI